MKRLYQVTLYSHKQNAYMKILLTVRETQNINDAEREANSDPGYRVHSSVFVCLTQDDVYLEI